MFVFTMVFIENLAFGNVQFIIIHREETITVIDHNPNPIEILSSVPLVSESHFIVH